jgi:integrase
VYLAPEAKPWLKEWLALRSGVSKTGPLFCRIRRGGHLHPQAHMSGGSIFRILEERREQVEDMEMEHFSPHDLRRTLCSELLEVEDISTVQQIAGHSTPATTVKYDRRGEKAKKRAANRVGFRKPKTS